MPDDAPDTTDPAPDPSAEGQGGYFLLPDLSRPRGWRLDIAEVKPESVVFRIPRHTAWMYITVIGLFAVLFVYILATEYPVYYRLIMRWLGAAGLAVAVLAAASVKWKTSVTVPKTTKLLVVPMRCYSSGVVGSVVRGVSPRSRAPWTKGLAVIAWDAPFMDVLCYVKDATDLSVESAACKGAGMRVETKDDLTVNAGCVSPWF